MCCAAARAPHAASELASPPCAAGLIVMSGGRLPITSKWPCSLGGGRAGCGRRRPFFTNQSGSSSALRPARPRHHPAPCQLAWSCRTRTFQGSHLPLLHATIPNRQVSRRRRGSADAALYAAWRLSSDLWEPDSSMEHVPGALCTPCAACNKAVHYFYSLRLGSATHGADSLNRKTPHRLYGMHAGAQDRRYTLVCASETLEVASSSCVL